MPSTPTEAKHTPWTAEYRGTKSDSMSGRDFFRVGPADVVDDPESAAVHVFGPHKEEWANLITSAINERASLLSLIEDMAKALNEANEALDAEPEYHHSGMGCGLEDRSIHDRYAAMEHGWDSALERAFDEQIDPAKSILASALSRYTEFLEQKNG